MLDERFKAKSIAGALQFEGNMPLEPAVGVGKIALARIAVHPGAIRTLAPADYPLEQSKQRLASFNLAALEDNCLFIGTKTPAIPSGEAFKAAVA